MPDRLRAIYLVIAFGVAWLPGYLAPHEVTAFLTFHHFSVGEAGWLSMSEVGALAVFSLLAAFLQDRVIGRVAVWAALCAAAGEGLSCLSVPFELLMPVRAVVGAGCAVCGLAATQEIAKLELAGTLFGYSTATLSALSAAFLALVPTLPGNAALRVFVPLVATCLALAVALARSRASNASAPPATTGGNRPGWLTGPVVALLIAVALGFLPIGGLWAFSAYQGEALGLSDATVGIILGWTTLSGLLGSAISVWTNRPSLRVAGIAAAFLASAATCVIVGNATSEALFATAFAVYNTTYMYAMSRILALAASLDESGKAAVIAMGVQLCAVAVGNVLVGNLLEAGQAALIWKGGALVSLIALIPAMLAARRRNNND